MAQSVPRSVFHFLLALVLTLLVAPAAHAQDTSVNDWKMRQQVAKGSIRVIAEDVNSSSLRAATEIAHLLARRDGLRLLPIAGRGGVENITDLLYLRDIDLAIVSLDALERIKAENTFPNLDRRVAYVTKLFNEEVHLLAQAATSGIAELGGKPVGVGPQGGSGDYAARTIFEAAGVTYSPVYSDYATALMKLQKGELGAVVMVSAKPLGLLSSLPEEGLRLLPVNYNIEAMPSYLPATLSAADYPNLLPAGETVQSIATQNVLLSFNWKKDTSRYEKVATFINQFFSYSPELAREVNHPKWNEFNLAARLPNWKRVEAAEEAVVKLAPKISAVKSCSPDDLRAAFNGFLAEANVRLTGEMSRADAEQLFTGFREWLKNQPIQQ